MKTPFLSCEERKVFYIPKERRRGRFPRRGKCPRSGQKGGGRFPCTPLSCSRRLVCPTVALMFRLDTAPAQLSAGLSAIPAPSDAARPRVGKLTASPLQPPVGAEQNPGPANTQRLSGGRAQRASSLGAAEIAAARQTLCASALFSTESKNHFSFRQGEKRNGS